MAKFQLAERALFAAFAQLKGFFVSMRRAEVHLQVWMESNLQSYNQEILDQARQSTGAYNLSVEGDFTSLRTALSEDAQRIFEKIAQCLDDFPRGVSESGKYHLRRKRRVEFNFLVPTIFINLL